MAAMAITADDLQSMVTHWLGTPPNGYLGSGYGSGVRDLLQQPMSVGGADALIAKLRSDITIMGELPQASLNLYAEQAPPDRVDLFFEVAGNFIRLDADGTVRPADL